MPLPKIKINEPQPVPCDDCGYEGYQYSDRLIVWYTSYYNVDGKYEGGFYNDSQNTVNRGITPHCSNCGKKLKFKLIRETLEDVKTKDQ